MCHLWPILCNILDFNIHAICLFCGSGKPDPVDEHLEELIYELVEIQNTVYNCEGVDYTFRIKAFSCDAPARAFLKCIVEHTSYYGCEICHIKGSWEEGRIMFDANQNHILRNDYYFRHLSYNVHQKKMSPLVDLSTGCVSQFALDYMHIICLGVTRRILHYLQKGPPCCRLSNLQISIISEVFTSF